MQCLRQGGALLQRMPATASALQSTFGWSDSEDSTPHGASNLHEYDHQSVVHRSLREVEAYQLPNQTNRLAMAFSPLDGFPFLCGLEVFQPHHKTAAHVHEEAYELFYILSGCGEAFCDGGRFSIAPGDVIVFPPGSVHGIDNADHTMYCVEVLLSSGGQDAVKFAEFVKAGDVMAFSDAELASLFAPGCAS